MDWTTTIQDPQELRTAFAGFPDNRYRPITAWWWSGEPVEEERLLWQFDRMVAMGFGGLIPTGLAPHGPGAGSAADVPARLSPEWNRLLRIVIDRCRDAGLGFVSLSPIQLTAVFDVPRLLRERPEFHGQMIDPDSGEVLPYGFDYGNREAVEALFAPETLAGRYLDEFGDTFGDPTVAMFEDEFPAFPRWAPGFADDFRRIKGYDAPTDAFRRDIGPRTPAARCDLFEVATQRALGAYTAWQEEFVSKHRLLAGYDQNHRRGTPIMSSLYALDPFRTMRWANAPGADQMGDARFHLSLADLSGAPRTWLEGFHSHGYGMSLSDQARLLVEWGREGMNLYLPHGVYYATKAFWWEWAPPEIGWRQPEARHYPAFAEFTGRLMMALAAGRHVPEVAVLYPLATVWAGTTGHLDWADFAVDTEQVYIDLFGMHDVPSGQQLERPARPSLLQEAGYDRITVDEANIETFDVPIVVPACRVLKTQTVQRLIASAEAGRVVVLVEPVPEWSVENGRDDAKFRALVDRLREVAVVVGSAAEAIAALPPPRVEGLKAQWRRVGDLDLVFVTGSGQARLRGMADRAPERWDPRTGAVDLLGASVDGADLLIDLEGPDSLIALPQGSPEPTREQAYDELLLPETWDCSYLPWGENRWGDYRLPANPGTPPVERRTFAHREGDDDSWQGAPVTPEDVQHPLVDLGFEQRMGGNSGRPEPNERILMDGWREVVSTYGPKAVLEDDRLLEYSERLGIEDLRLSTPLGLKGRVESLKADLGHGGAGRITSWAYVPVASDTYLVVEGKAAVVTAHVDGQAVAGPVDLGVLSAPVHLDAGWHRVDLDVQARDVIVPAYRGYCPPPATKLGWAFTQPYARDALAVWGGKVMHPDYRGAPGPRRFRRRITVPERAAVTVRSAGSGDVTFEMPQVLEPGEHELVATVGRAPSDHRFMCEVELEMGPVRVVVGSDELWETAGVDVDDWACSFEIGAAGAIGWAGPAEEQAPRRHALLDVAWLEGDEVLQGHVEQVWADRPEEPPPAWFCFTAPPGARGMTLPVAGDVQAWQDGEPVEPDGEVLPLREHARVALRVQASAGHRGAACFREHPLLDLGPGTIQVGRSWHRQGLDVFSGVILHRTSFDAAEETEALLDLGDVRGSVSVRVNGEEAGVLFMAPWRLPIDVRAGSNLIELEVANTLGPWTSRGIPTAFGPEDQRFSGILGRPRVLLLKTDKKYR